MTDNVMRPGRATEVKLDRNSSMKDLNDARDEIKTKLYGIEADYVRAAKMDPQYVELIEELNRLEACVRLKTMLDYGSR